MTHNSATEIKCRISNELHKMLEPNINLKKSKRWYYKKNYTDQEKIEIFDKILKLHDETSEEISNCLYKRREKKRVLENREKIKNELLEKKVS